ncbi:hypothetical protein [Shewanella algae]|uniref:hypothetical protein n=1 Tax=Shewanella algae TaxID=38313 RepID=UPI001AAC620F|nr:hypothetical protein [Shewanella algae]MBO2676253.1 hypothetical protein [Shewanella algae]BCV33645.1 hypothetical protein TUM4442_31720 [Shewanella algae]
MSDRVADSTIKGFLYQFNKTILEIANADDEDVITVEGVVEDVDVLSASGELEAIQCKYHESREKFTPSLIFKPLLQMAEAYDKNPTAKIKYTIFIYVLNETHGERSIELSTLDSALATTDKSLLKIVSRISGKFDKDEFLKNTRIVFGPSLDEIEDSTKDALELLRIQGSDVGTLLYPNSIAIIAKLSSTKNEAERQITKAKLYSYLLNATHTAISKWTLALKNRSEILKRIKQQLSSSFSQNSRDRYFYINKNDIDDYEEKVVVFFGNYIKKYYSKPSHLKAPTFIINDNFDAIRDLESRLYKKGIKANTGLVGNDFEVDYFFRDPMKKIISNNIEEREFDLRLLAMDSEKNAINHRKGDDLYLVSSETPNNIELTDVNFYQVGTSNFNELEYVIGMRNCHE